MFFQWIHYLFGLQRLECTDHAETCVAWFYNIVDIAI